MKKIPVVTDESAKKYIREKFMNKSDKSRLKVAVIKGSDVSPFYQNGVWSIGERFYPAGLISGLTVKD